MEFVTNSLNIRSVFFTIEWTMLSSNTIRNLCACCVFDVSEQRRMKSTILRMMIWYVKVNQYRWEIHTDRIILYLIWQSKKLHEINGPYDLLVISTGSSLLRWCFEFHILWRERFAPFLYPIPSERLSFIRNFFSSGTKIKRTTVHWTWADFTFALSKSVECGKWVGMRRDDMDKKWE